MDKIKPTEQGIIHRIDLGMLENELLNISSMLVLCATTAGDVAEAVTTDEKMCSTGFGLEQVIIVCQEKVERLLGNVANTNIPDTIKSR